MRRILFVWNDFAGDRNATTLLEFAFAAPVFLSLLVAILGVGVDGYYQLLLDDALRNAARQLQILGPASTSGNGFATAVCSELGVVAAGCVGTLTYNVQTNAPPALFASLQPITMPPSGKLPNAFPALSGNANVLIQVAFPLPVNVPFVGTAMTLNGTNAILATTTVRTEPHS